MVVVEDLTNNPERFKRLSEAIVETGENRRKYNVVSCSALSRGWLVKFEGVNDRDQADQLKGSYLLTVTADLPELEEGNYYLFDLVGVEVFTTSGEMLGTLESIDQYPANDIYVVVGARGRLMIPAIRDVVKSIDIKNKRMEVELLSGLEFE